MNVPITRSVWGMPWIDDSKDMPIGMVCVCGLLGILFLTSTS